jgi:thiol-disulfide isomerase/thioredoxin
MRNFLFSSVFVAAALVAAGAAAFQVQAYDKAAADAAIAAGKPVVLEVYAPWCPSCLMQSAAVESLKDRPDFKDIRFYRVDYDNQKDVVAALNSPRATLIAYRGGKEVGRMSWNPSEDEVAKILMKAVK